MNDTSQTFSLRPIGVIRTGLSIKFSVRHQPTGRTDVCNVIELEKHRNFEPALRDLEGFTHIWVVSWFDRNTTWRPVVMPPRGSDTKRGVFATRSPHRPNPIGVTVVPLLRIEGLKVFVGEVDLLDATPILDLKPYLASVDSVPDAGLGWVQEVEDEYAIPATYNVRLEDLATRQLNWLRDHYGISLIDRVIEILERDPRPHRTRRIRRLAGDNFEIGCGTWRALYRVDHKEVIIYRVLSGYAPQLVFGEASPYVQEQEAHLAFMREWGPTTGIEEPYVDSKVRI